MDISQWPMDKIMQLPDWCFGRRWQILTCRKVLATVTDEWMVKESLPDRTVLWRIFVSGYVASGVYTMIKFALTNNEPASDAEFDALPRIFKGDLENVAYEGALELGLYFPIDLRMRLPIESAGKRFAIQFYNGHATVWAQIVVSFEISSIPKEIPDWLISAPVSAL